MWNWAHLHPYLFTILGLATPVTIGLVVLLSIGGAVKIINARRSGKNIFESMLDLTRYADEKKRRSDESQG